MPNASLPERPHRDVGVTAQAALFEVAVVDADGHEHVAHEREVGRGGRGAAQVGLGHDLDQRRAGAVQVDAGEVRVAGALVQRLARVLFHVDAGDADTHGLAVDLEIDVAAGRDRSIELRDLVALGQVRVEVVLSRELGHLVHRAPEGDRRRDGLVHGVGVEHRQGPGQAEAHRTGVGVGRRAERGHASTEDLGTGLELGVHLEADHGLEAHRDGSRRHGEIVMPLRYPMHMPGNRVNVRTTSGSNCVPLPRTSSATACSCVSESRNGRADRMAS